VKGEICHGRMMWEGERRSKQGSCEGEMCRGRNDGKGERESK